MSLETKKKSFLNTSCSDSVAGLRNSLMETVTVYTDLTSFILTHSLPRST